MKDTRTDEQLNRIIAEWVGWVNLDGWHSSPALHAPPKYCSDLNAIHGAEKNLNPCDWQQYSQAIRRVIHRDCNRNECYIPGCERAGWIADVWFYGATAHQRAEALVSVIESQKEPHA